MGIALIVAKKLQINNRKKVDVVKDLTRLKFQKFGETRPPRSGYEYLLIMQIVSLTKERKEELERMAKQKAAELEKVKRTPIDRMWTEDLDRLEEAINNLYAQADDEPIVKGKKRKALQKTSSSRRGAKGRGQSNKKPDDEEEDLSDEEKEDTGDMDNPFSDISRWTAGALNLATQSGGPRKKRRT